MHPERVSIAKVSAVVVTIVAAVVVATAVGAFGSLQLGYLFPIIQAQATFIEIVTPL
jgi:hypothetical protein